MSNNTWRIAAIASACFLSACVAHNPYDYPYDRVGEAEAVPPEPPPPPPPPPRDIRPADMRPTEKEAPRYAEERPRAGVYDEERSRDDRAFGERLRRRGVTARYGRRGMYLDVPSDLLFGLDSAQLRPGARDIAAMVAERLQRDPSLSVRILGYTDTSGTRAHNQQLSEERADAVARELERRGIDPRRIEARGLGERNLAVPTRDGVREPRNRRVEIIVEDGRYEPQATEPRREPRSRRPLRRD